MMGMRFWLSVAAVATIGAPLAIGSGAAAPASAGPSKHMAINCAQATAMCAEVVNSDEVFGHYVGHDEPSLLFNSTTPGAGNHMRYNLTLPRDPSA